MNMLEGLLKEIDRNKELLQEYKKIGPGGTFATIIIEDKLEEAKQSIIGGDVIKMISCYNDLQESQ